MVQRWELGLGLGLGLGVVLWNVRRGSAFRLWLWRRLTPWQPVGVVSELYLYPLKSGRGIRVESCEVEERTMSSGETRDRCFMVWDPKRSMKVTARDIPKLVTITPSVSGACLTLSVPDPELPDLILNMNNVLEEDERVTVNLWFKAEIEGLDCGDWAGSWLSRVLGREGLRLLFHPPSGCRNARFIHNEDFHNPRFKARPDRSLFQDLGTCMAFSTLSLSEVNTRLAEEVTDRHFRPNIVFDKVDYPFVEDTWQDVKIGGCEMSNVKKCTRCVFTTIHPDKGEKDARGEPLKTLATLEGVRAVGVVEWGVLRFRQAGQEDPDKRDYKSSPLFGINLAVDEPGTIAVGDTVYARL